MMIKFDEFKKLDLRIARILKAERVKDSEKLLLLEISLGGLGKRQILAGIAKFYKTEELIGRKIVVVVNLEEKTLFGFKSQGMLLAAEDKGEPVLLMPDKDAEEGSKIH